jgi:hypothetical protein
MPQGQRAYKRYARDTRVGKGSGGPRTFRSASDHPKRAEHAATDDQLSDVQARVRATMLGRSAPLIGRGAGAM